MSIKTTKGFSLVEILIFIAILSVVLVASVSVTTFFFKTTSVNQHKILASHYADEALEWIKSEKETDWNIFINRGSLNGSTYCLVTLNWSTPGTCNGNQFLNNIFLVEGTLTNRDDGTGVVDRTYVKVKIYWQEGVNQEKIEINSTLKIIE